MPSKLEWAAAITLPVQLTLLASYLYGRDEESDSSNPSYIILFVLYLFLDSSYAQFFSTLLLIPARYVASCLPGAAVPEWGQEEKWIRQEDEFNDSSLVWPKKEVLEKLPTDWIAKNSNGGSMILQNQNKTINGGVIQVQQYYLNHARGSTRIRQASQRLGAALGTLSSSFLLCNYVSVLSLRDIGLDWSRDVTFDICRGIFVGAFIVTFIFLVEWMLGWIKIIGYFETVDPQERFHINIIWDVLFHIGVSINEETMLRGWMFTLCARGINTMVLGWFDESTAGVFAIIFSILLQSAFFAAMHHHSPGSTSVSLINLFIGGIAGSFNFLVAGGTLWLGIGWHFGWNIMMGHVLGLTTSGIPLSCAVFDVIPRPEESYVKLHGGTFGPELGVLAPLSYLLGMIIVSYMYGFDDMIEFGSKAL